MGVASVLVTSGVGRAARREVEKSLGSVTPDLLVVMGVVGPDGKAVDRE